MFCAIKFSYFTCFIALNSWTLTRGEFFTAISDVALLLGTHQKVVDDLEVYIDNEEKRLAVIKRYLVKYKSEHDKALDDVLNYLGNPLNAFTLIKRLTTDLNYVKQNIEQKTEYINNMAIFNNNTGIEYPTQEDLTGAAQALTRLQKTYHLDVKDLSEGRLIGVIYRDMPGATTPISTSDCYELGKALYDEKDYTNALPWMMAALNKYSDKEDKLFSKVDILEYISTSHFNLDDIREAIEWTMKILKLNPGLPRARTKLQQYKEALVEKDTKLKRRLRGDTGEEGLDEEKLEAAQKKPEEEPSKATILKKTYEALCRGEMSVPTNVAKKLTCRYLTENHPFLKLAPIKMEYVYLNPDIALYHDVLSDNEIDHIKKMAKSRIARSIVSNPKLGDMKASFRISKSGWIADEESRVVATLSQRVADITRFNMTYSEDLQILNYGIGGQYEPHCDFHGKKLNDTEMQNDNRIATVLFYMTDVSQGGATVFTDLGLTVFPVKGSAVFWQNLLPSGEGDFNTRHAACPVLRGSKWVCNKWIHQRGQELLKPCTREDQMVNATRTLQKPVSKTII